MKKTTLSLLSALVLCVTVNAQEAQDVKVKEIKNDNGFENFTKNSIWLPNCNMNQRKPGGTMEKVDGGRSGKCLEIKNTPASTFDFTSGNYFSVNVATDAIKMAVYVKGKGCFRMGLYCYDKDKKWIAPFMQATFVKVDSENWNQEEFIYDFSMLTEENVANVMIAFEVKEDSHLFFDDFSAVIEKKKDSGN
jgi:hypothetical protein